MSDAAPRTLLLAEDDADIAYIFRRMFRSFEPKWRLEWVPDGLAAVNYCMKHGPPDALVTDLNMPNMTGFEVMDWLAAHPLPGRTPFLVYSSSDDEATCERCRKAGAVDFISKQANTQALRAGLEHFLEAYDGTGTRNRSPQ